LTSELEKLRTVMLHYAERYSAEYRERWIPSSQQIQDGLELFKPVMAGFDAYTVEDINKRLDVFFRCKEPWITGGRHNFSVFIKHIQRWVGGPAVVGARHDGPGRTREKTDRCPDHPEQFLVNGICPICFPMCAKCGQHHATTETCEEFKQRDDWVRRTFGGPETRTSDTTTIAGSQVFNEKAKKEFREIRTQQERER
jgi:hypothetical protein